jgi:hypothetical protein
MAWHSVGFEPARPVPDRRCRPAIHRRQWGRQYPSGSSLPSDGFDHAALGLTSSREARSIRIGAYRRRRRAPSIARRWQAQPGNKLRHDANETPFSPSDCYRRVSITLSCSAGTVLFR